jgi:hypothetical protein
MPDDWLAPDKAQHFVACFTITVLAYVGLQSHWCKPPRQHAQRLVLSAALSVAVGAAKELLDYLDVRVCMLSLCPCEHQK